MGRYYALIVYILCCILLKVKAEERLLWFSSKPDIAFIAPNYLPESKKENRRVAVVLEGEFKKLEIECIMSGFEGDESSQPKWTTYFEDWQISNKGQEPVIQNEYARWKIYVNVTNNDAGIQKLSCNYQQGYFAKVIEVEFDIYNNIKPVIADDLICQRNGVENECVGKVRLEYEQGNSNPIPDNKIIENVKKQLHDIYQTNDVGESDNIFTVSIDLKSAITNLGNKKWVRKGSEVDISNLVELCGCETDETPTTPITLQTTPSLKNESETSGTECSEDDIQCIEPLVPTTTSTIQLSTSSTKSSSSTSTKKSTTTKNPINTCINDGQSRDESCILDITIYNNLTNSYNNDLMFWKPKKAQIFNDAQTLSDAQRGMLGAQKPDWNNLLMPLKLQYNSNELPKSFRSNSSLIKNKNWCGSSWAWTAQSVLMDRMLLYNKNNNHVPWPRSNYCLPQAGAVEDAWSTLRYIGYCEPAYRVGNLWKDTDKLLKENMYDIMWEVMNYGPVEAVMKVYSDLFLYGSGVYHHTHGNLVGHHAVKIVGWGEEVMNSVNVEYWIVANNWGQTWGEDGYFRIIRGENQSNIERYVIGARPSQKHIASRLRLISNTMP